jgi:hypothetical protein
MSTNAICGHIPLINDDVQDPWNEDLLLAVNIVPHLNSAGRQYMVSEPTNQDKGFKVLEEWRYDLDCLFYHVRENPALCRRHHNFETLKRETLQLPIPTPKRPKL